MDSASPLLEKPASALRRSPIPALSAGGTVSASQTWPSCSVAMREISLSGGEPPMRVYDASGPYSDPNAAIDIEKGLPRLRQ